MRIFAILGVVLALGVGIYMYERSAASLPAGESPTEQIDTVAIRQRLLTIAETERRYQATNGTYATLEQLSQDSLLPGGTEHRGYRFTGVVNGSTGFTITATPIDRNKVGWPTLVVTESMQVTEQ
jgi:Tfp pilus assembly protein PilE